MAVYFSRKKKKKEEIWITADLSLESMEAKRKWHNISLVLKEKTY